LLCIIDDSEKSILMLLIDSVVPATHKLPDCASHSAHRPSKTAARSGRANIVRPPRPVCTPKLRRRARMPLEAAVFGVGGSLRRLAVGARARAKSCWRGGLV
jgi:hypothetical protein